MLPPDYLLNKADAITAVYRDFYTAVLADIARRISDTLKATGKAELLPSAEYQYERAMQAGLLQEEIIKHTARLSGVARKEIAALFENAAQAAISYDNKIYAAAGLSPVDINQSPAMLQTLRSGMTKTFGGIHNLTGTTTIIAEQKFFQLTNEAYNKVAMGAFDHRQALGEAVDRIAREGLRYMDYASGSVISIEGGVRRALLTGVNQTAAEITTAGMKAHKVTLVRVTAHIGARNKDNPERPWVNHEKFQGKVYHYPEMGKEPSITEKSKYPDFLTNTGYGKVDGLCGANCRHSFGPYYEGLSPVTYSDAELDGMSKQTVTFTDWKTGDKKTISYYEATRTQRKMERSVREWQRKAQIKTTAGIDASAEKERVKHWQKRLMRFTDETGLRRDYSRERIAGQK